MVGETGQASYEQAIRAGRLGLWLLSRRQHRRRIAREMLRPTYHLEDRYLLRRFAAIVTPWRIYDYPGAPRVLASILGISLASSQRYLRSRKIPRQHADRLADYLEQHSAQSLALAVEFREYAGRGGSGAVR